MSESNYMPMTICPDCHAACLETRFDDERGKMQKCPLCGFSVLKKRKLETAEQPEGA
jgi:hypothetical protein